MPSDRQPWWQRAVVYQIYVRSFADSDGDGIGDLRGILDRLDYLEWLGVETLWLSPVTVSPDTDWGYDVSDYVDVQPVLGTLDVLDELVAKAGERNMRIVLDFVPNHTSDQHAWFVEARSSRDAPHRDWYVWADPKPDGSPPNNWRSTFKGAPAWTLDDATGQYYLHNFLATQPDVNWWNDEVREAFDEVLRFWLDRGIAGFRIDVAHGIVKDRELRDNPDPAVSTYNAHREEVHDVHKRFRRVVDAYEPERILLGETWVMEPERLARFYGSGDDELHLAFNFPFTFAPLESEALRTVVEQTEAVLPPGAWPVWMLSNHDIPRFTTRTCGGDERKIRCALLALLTLRGTAVLYYGDELGMEQADVPEERERDMAGRDGARTPLPWTPDGGWNDPWLPLGDTSRNVAGQRADPSSTLSFCRDVIALRRSTEDLLSGAYETLPAPAGVWAFRRGGGTAVALNLADEPATLSLDGTVRLGTGTGDAEELAPWEGIVLDV
jgi:alpha-glucosidase